MAGDKHQLMVLQVVARVNRRAVQLARIIAGINHSRPSSGQCNLGVKRRQSREDDADS